MIKTFDYSLILFKLLKTKETVRNVIITSFGSLFWCFILKNKTKQSDNNVAMTTKRS
jgi:hypothetical protein